MNEKLTQHSSFISIEVIPMETPLGREYNKFRKD